MRTRASTAMPFARDVSAKFVRLQISADEPWGTDLETAIYKDTITMSALKLLMRCIHSAAWATLVILWEVLSF